MPAEIEPGPVTEAGAQPATAEGHRLSSVTRAPPSPPESPPPTAGPPGGRVLDRAVRAAEAGPRYCWRSALVSLALTSLLAIAIALHVRPSGPLRGPQHDIVRIALACLFLTVLLAIASFTWPQRKRGWLDRVVGSAQRAAIWLALTAWFPLLLVVVYYRCRATLPPSVVWIAFGYLDKRWVTSLYLVGALAPMLLLVAAARVLAVGRQHPRTWRAWLAGLAPLRATAAQAKPESGEPHQASAPQFGWPRLTSIPAVRVAAGVLTSIGIGWYFYGPPWYLSRPAAGPIGFQEDVFLAGFQAIAKGATPYIGPAAMQYGPGAQLASYLLMRHVTTFSVVGFRESWAVFGWAGATFLFVVFFLAFGYLRGLVAALLSVLAYPALQQLGFLPTGAYGGFFGWANPLRYVGAIALILLLPMIMRRYPARGALAAAAVLGLFFGAMSYLAQENLAAGIIGAVVVGALLLLTASASLRAVVVPLLWAAAGFLVVWVPVLAYYAVHHVLARFLQLYLLIPLAVSAGYSNTPYGGYQSTAAAKAAQDKWALFFYVLPFVLAILALLCAVQVRPLRVAFEWSRERIMLASIVLTTILLYEGALLRSDASHLAGTMLATPGLVIMVATVLPRLLGAVRPVTIAVGAVVLFVASLLLLPSSSVRPSQVASWAAAPVRDRGRGAAAPAPARTTTVAAGRVGAGLVRAAQCCQSPSVPMGRFLSFMNDLHQIIGNRVTYVVSFPSGYPGIVYFIADLTPAPIPLDPHTMVLNEPQERAFLADFRSAVLPKTAAVVTPSLSAPEASYFLRRYQGATVITLTYLHQPMYVLLRPGPATGPG